MDILYLYRFIPIILFLHPYILAHNRKNKISKLICGLYLTSSIGSLFVSPYYLSWHDFENDTFFGFLYYGLFNLPFLYISLNIKPFYTLENIRFDIFTKLFMGILGAGAVYSVFYQLPYVIKAMSMSAYEVRTMGESLLPSSFFTTIAVGFPMFLFLYVFYFYLNLVKRWNKFLGALMLLGAFNFVINALTISGRDGLLFFILAFILGYLLFENYLTKKNKIYLRYIGSIIFIAGLVIITIFTLSRFSTAKEESVYYAFNTGILNYFSMQAFTFNDVLKFHESFSYGNDSFPLFFSWFSDLDNQKRNLSMPYMWNFSGYVGTFYKNGGYEFLSLLILIFYLIFRSVRKMHLNFYLYSFSILSFYFFFMTSGLFYFRLGNSGGNLFILFSLVMMLLFKKRIVF